jgi:hypothetical protein
MASRTCRILVALGAFALLSTACSDDDASDSTATTVASTATSSPAAALEPTLAAAIDAGEGDGTLCRDAELEVDIREDLTVVTAQPEGPDLVALACRVYASNVAWQLAFWDGAVLTPIDVLVWDEPAAGTRLAPTLLSTIPPQGAVFVAHERYPADGACRSLSSYHLEDDAVILDQVREQCPEPSDEWLVAYGPAATGRARAVADAFLAFARGTDGAPAPRFADEVEIVLGPEATEVVPVDDPTDLASWVTPELASRHFRGAVGPFEPLRALAAVGDVSVTVGPHRTCALPGFVTPAGDLAGLLQISIGNADPQVSCVEWFSVDLMLDASFRIEAVIYDLYEP